jgi:hypothetical protein
MPFALLLAMQAAGMVVDYFGVSQQSQMAEMGAKIQQAGIESNIAQTQLETEDASLQAMKNLRQQLGTQIATFAARGTRTGAGSAVSFLTESIGNFGADERMRRMNLMGKVNSLKAGGTIAKLQGMGENTKLWSDFSSRTLNRFPSSLSGWKQGVKDFSEGFGLTRSA